MNHVCCCFVVVVVLLSPVVDFVVLLVVLVWIVVVLMRIDEILHLRNVDEISMIQVAVEVADNVL